MFREMFSIYLSSPFWRSSKRWGN